MVQAAQNVDSVDRKPSNDVTKSSALLAAFGSNVHSQCGEDGVILRILEILPDCDRWCVEFGAWDGEHLSNTSNLIERLGYSAVLIEGNEHKSVALKRKYAKNVNVTTVNQYVGFTDVDNLDAILSETPIPETFDFLSIDIDGNDYHAWKAVARYRPKVVCIEFNQTIPTEVSFIQPANASIHQGASLRALVDLGKSKGYELISVSPINAFFVRSELFPLFAIEDNRPEVLRTDVSDVTYLFSGYDGTIFLAGRKLLPWHGIPITERGVQCLPRWLRQYPLNYGPLRNAAFYLFKELVYLPAKFKQLWQKVRRFF